MGGGQPLERHLRQLELDAGHAVPATFLLRLVLRRELDEVLELDLRAGLAGGAVVVRLAVLASVHAIVQRGGGLRGHDGCHQCGEDENSLHRETSTLSSGAARV